MADRYLLETSATDGYQLEDGSGVLLLEGVPAANITGAGGIASAEAFGSPDVQARVDSAGIPTAETFGSPAVRATISASGIASAEAFGSPALSVTITAIGIPSAEDFGLPTVIAVVPAHDITDAGGIPSEEAFGGPTVSRQAAPQPSGHGGGIYYHRGPKVYITVPSGKKKKKVQPAVPVKPKPEESDIRKQVMLKALEKIAKAGKSYQHKPVILIDRKLLKFKAIPRIAGVGGIPSQESFGKPTITLIDGGTRYEKALEEMLLIWTA